MYRRIIGVLFLVFCSFFILTSCKESADKLTIGMIPVRDGKEMIESFEPIRLYLEEKLEIPVEVIVTENYC